MLSMVVLYVEIASILVTPLTSEHSALSTKFDSPNP
jgi:hypothetical protein